jgi:hypothetical protein
MNIRAALPGDSVCMPTTGGVRSRPAPGTGLVVSLDEYDLFLPEDIVRVALLDLERKITNGGISQLGDMPLPAKTGAGSVSTPERRSFLKTPMKRSRR